jgi:MoaA/NifB/PqqE/SkfB family radical SAM enzyme
MDETLTVDSQPTAGLHPQTATIEVTRRCNLACKTCFADSTTDAGMPQLSTDTLLTMVDELVRLGVSSFHVGGGEPTLHPGFLEIVQHIRSRGAVAGFSTNGTLLTEHLVDRMSACGVRNNIFVSLDGPDSASYRKIRVSPSFDTVTAGLRRLKQSGLQFAVSMVVCQPTVHLIPRMFQLGEELGAQFLNLIRFNLEGRGGRHWEELEPERDFEEICEPYLRQWNGRMGFFGENCILPINPALRIRLPEEGDLRRFVAISAEGEVSLGRASAGIRIGNIRDGGFTSVWNGPSAASFLSENVTAAEFLREITTRRAAMADRFRVSAVAAGAMPSPIAPSC